MTEEQKLLEKLDKLSNRVEKDISDDICSGLTEKKAGVMVEFVLDKPEGLKKEHIFVCQVLANYFLDEADKKGDKKGAKIWSRRWNALYD